MVFFFFFWEKLHWCCLATDSWEFLKTKLHNEKYISSILDDDRKSGKFKESKPTAPVDIKNPFLILFMTGIVDMKVKFSVW